jgi:glycosyltransferase involved in cell wall biosynthesis
LSGLELTVLMPAYNEGPTIERAIAAVIAAGVAASWELIVVDDGSTDGTRELLSSREWPEHVRVLRPVSRLKPRQGCRSSDCAR